MDLRLENRTLNGSIDAIASKSQAHRLLICAALSSEPTTVICTTSSKDIEATAACLKAMGAGIARDGDLIRVSPIERRSGRCVLPCGESGSTLRFLLPVAASLGLECDFLMEGRLPQRPLYPLDEELMAHGITLEHPEPGILRCSGKLSPGAFRIPGNISSQFISGLLFALPLLDKESTLTVTGRLESAPYVSLTLDALKQCGVNIPKSGDTYIINSSKYACPQEMRVEGDWSNAAFWLAAGAVSGGIEMGNLRLDSLQGDKKILSLLEDFGAKTEYGENSVRLSPAPLHGIEIDAGDIPDLVPILAVVACAAQGTTRIYNAERLRIKESDRLKTVSAMINSLGGKATETADGLIIEGTALTGGCTDSCNDHRIAMSAAIASALCKGQVTVLTAQAVDKSYPGFWSDFKALGGICKEV